MTKKIEYSITRNGQIDNSRFATFKEAFARGLEISCICLSTPKLVVFVDGVVKLTSTEMKRKIKNHGQHKPV
jgi:hypothetical protein